MKSHDQVKYSKSPDSSIKYDESTLVRFLKWLGTCIFIIASTSMALFGHKYVDMQLYIFMAYVLGAICWLIVGVMLKDRPQIVLYCVFAAVDITGIITRLI